MEFIKIYPDNPNPRQVAEAVKRLQNGEVAIYPTDTLYAIGCDALNVKSVERICRIKGVNPLKANLSIICSDLSDLSHYVKVSNSHFKLMKRNLPGAFTFILPTNANLPRIYKNRKTVGIRVPDHPIVLAIVEALGNPLLTTSVVCQDDAIEYATDPTLIAESYEHDVDFMVDGGYGGFDQSTVVDCTDTEPVIVRQGKGELLI